MPGRYAVACRASVLKTSAIALLGSLATSCAVPRTQPDASLNTQNDPTMEAAFHDVLAHADLSDVGFVAKTLGFEFKVVRSQAPVALPGEHPHRDVIATHAPSYAHPYGMFYDLTRNAARATTEIRFTLWMNSCPDLQPWAKDWNQEMRSETSVATDAGGTYYFEVVKWQNDPEGISVERMVGDDDSCRFALQQNTHAALAFPESPTATPGPGSQLLDEIVDLIVAGDLRDYRTTERLLHTAMSTSGTLRQHRLYKANVTPAQVIAGTDTRWFDYYANDTGWIETSPPLGYQRRRGSRSVKLSIYIDTDANCIASESVGARLRERHVRFRTEAPPQIPGVGPILRTSQHGNEMWLTYSVEGSCVKSFGLDQVTHAP
ncbi:MAG TPA: hypothetical protein VGM84_26875 [Steroidobacteraceae bacterium]